MKINIKYFLTTALCFTTACSSLPKGTLLGATVGLGVGGIVGNNQENNSQKNLSLAAGALIGGVIGYFQSESKIKKDRELKTGQNLKDFIPKLNRPEVRRVWVPDQITGDEYISGHWKFLIDKNAVWSKSEE